VQIKNTDWNKISVFSDSSGLRRYIHLNDNNIYSFELDHVSNIESLIIGDYDCDHCYGTVYYDDIEIIDITSYIPPEDHNIVVGRFGIGYTFAGPTFNLGVTWELNKHIIFFKYTKGDELQPQIFFSPERKMPNKQFREFALLFGLYFPQQKGISYFSGGLGYVDVVIGEN
jgi:hypothetical protein